MKAKLMADSAAILSGAIAASFDQKANREFSKAIAAMRRVGDPEPDLDEAVEPAQEGEPGG